jgi:hypothetical protein
MTHSHQLHDIKVCFLGEKYIKIKGKLGHTRLYTRQHTHMQAQDQGLQCTHMHVEQRVASQHM